jgi:hypothetical protein
MKLQIWLMDNLDPASEVFPTIPEIPNNPPFLSNTLFQRKGFVFIF